MDEYEYMRKYATESERTAYFRQRSSANKRKVRFVKGIYMEITDRRNNYVERRTNHLKYNEF
jgi:hypothetical protein